jgi:hypothetical protein
MSAASSIPSEADIIEQVIAINKGSLTPEVARSFLDFQFEPKTKRLIRQLLTKNNKGTITEEERLTLEKYLRVGHFLDLIHARARLSLRGPANSH